jgi:hypothetical protein
LQQVGVKVNKVPSIALYQHLEWPNGFENKKGKEEVSKDNSFVSHDASCDIQATLDYLKSGQGNTKILQGEALAKNTGILEHAQETSAPILVLGSANFTTFCSLSRHTQ